MHELICGCSCGKARVAVSSRPFARLICHCTICQAVYRAPFADVTILRGSAVRHIENVQFKKHRAPPALNRGTCISCGSPVVATAPFLAFIQAPNYPRSRPLPAPAMHIFYHSRVADADDSLPKHSGYWRSQWAFTRLVMSSAFRAQPDA